MANTVLAWLLGIPLLGLATGMRAMAPVAVCCWCAHFGLLQVNGTWAFWLAHPVSVAIFTLAAVAEMVGDKLPKTPPRIAPVGLISRLAFAGVLGATVATVLQNSIPIGALLAIFGAVIGAYGGYLARRDLVRKFRCRDWPVAVLEDFVTILIAVFAVRLSTS